MDFLQPSLIHGIEERRTELGKDLIGTIRLRFLVNEHTFRICMEDDGSGFDLDNLRQQVVDRGLMEAASADSADLTQILEELAGDGFSAKGEAELFTGRGVGIGTVFDIIREQQGSIKITSEPGEGTMFSLETPRSSQVFRSGHAPPRPRAHLPEIEAAQKDLRAG